jgi:hypothetical protein
MNPTFLGDSYDLVKRFFVLELQSLGYVVEIDPMFTGSWMGRENEFYRLVGMATDVLPKVKATRSSLFLDPDTGLNERGGKQHASLARIARETQEQDLVFAFDQSFSRQARAVEIMKKKMKVAEESKKRDERESETIAVAKETNRIALYAMAIAITAAIIAIKDEMLKLIL